MITKTLRIEIFGKVASPSFKQNLGDFAQQVGLVGRLTSISDDAVDVVVSGSEGSLTQFINVCKQGISNARVDDVVITPLADSHFDSFEIV